MTKKDTDLMSLCLSLLSAGTTDTCYHICVCGTGLQAQARILQLSSIEPQMLRLELLALINFNFL